MALLSPDNVGPPDSAAPEGIPLEQYRVAFDRNPQPMWVYDLGTLRFIAVNDAAIEHYGYARGEFLAMTIEDIRPSDDVPALRERIDQQGEGLERSGVWRHRAR